MKSTAVLASAFVVAASSEFVITGAVKDAFTRFTEKYGKTYDNAEYNKRLSIFADNFKKVSGQNDEHVLLGGSAVFGITKFSDLSAEEFKSMYLTYIPRNVSAVDRVTIETTMPMADVVDWRTTGAVTSVKDQGQCGSCWAFSATEAIESYAFLAGQKLQELSVQQINSCDNVDGGCNGGNTESAYDYVMQAGGITTESEYPYTSGGGNTGSCKGSTTPAVKITGYNSISQGEDNLQSALSEGPVSICVAADAFQSYSSGVLKVCRGQIDHCVQAVGYDSANGYWIVRNSWGTGWGEDGFIRIEMGKDLCHIADDVTVPTF